MNATSLLNLFNGDIGTAERLLELIESEFQALNEKDLSRLQQILTDKQPLLISLEQHGKIRSKTLADLQLSADRTGLQALAAQSPQGDELLLAGDRLNELLENCQQANLRNGRVIRANQQSTSQMLGILRGGESPSLYDSSGSTAKVGHKRPLSQA